MWINAMSRVARRKGITIPELLKQQRKNSLNLTCLPKTLKSRNKKTDPGDVEKMGPALALTMLTVLYGYLLKLVTIAFRGD